MNFNIKIFPAHACATLTSMIPFGGNKIYSGRRERYFSSKYFKENINEMNYGEENVYFMDSTIKLQKKYFFI